MTLNLVVALTRQGGPGEPWVATLTTVGVDVNPTVFGPDASAGVVLEQIAEHLDQAEAAAAVSAGRVGREEETG